MPGCLGNHHAWSAYRLPSWVNVMKRVTCADGGLHHDLAEVGKDGNKVLSDRRRGSRVCVRLDATLDTRDPISVTRSCLRLMPR